MTALVVGADPGKVSGYGCARVLLAGGRPELLSWGQCKGNGAEIAAVLDECEAHAARLHAVERVLVVESQFVKDRESMPTKKRRGMQRAALHVAHNRGKWIGDVERRGGWIVLELHPSTWRQAQLGSASLPREVFKAQAVAVAGALYGITIPKSRDHAAEGILLATHGARERQLAAQGVKP